MTLEAKLVRWMSLEGEAHEWSEFRVWLGEQEAEAERMHCLPFAPATIPIRFIAPVGAGG